MNRRHPFLKWVMDVKVSVVALASTPWLLDLFGLPNDTALNEVFHSRYVLCPGGWSTMFIKYHPQAGILAVLSEGSPTFFPEAS